MAAAATVPAGVGVIGASVAKTTVVGSGMGVSVAAGVAVAVLVGVTVDVAVADGVAVGGTGVGVSVGAGVDVGGTGVAVAGTGVAVGGGAVGVAVAGCWTGTDASGTTNPPSIKCKSRPHDRELSMRTNIVIVSDCATAETFKS